MVRRLLALGLVGISLLAPPLCPCARTTAADLRSAATAAAGDEASRACPACRVPQEPENGRPCEGDQDCSCPGHGPANLIATTTGGIVPAASLMLLPLVPVHLAEPGRVHASAGRAPHAPRSPPRSLTIRLRTLLI